MLSTRLGSRLLKVQRSTLSAPRSINYSTVQKKSYSQVPSWKAKSSLPARSQSETTLSSFGNTREVLSFKRFYSDGEKIVTVKVPPLADSISEGTIQQWHKKAGDSVAVDDLVTTLETDKITIDIRATESGVMAETLAEEGDTLLVGADLYRIDTSAAPKAEPKKEVKKEETKAPKEEPKAAPKEAPKAAPKAAPTPQAPATPAAAPGERGEHRVRMTRIRQRISDRLKGAQNTYAMLTTFNEVDMSKLMELRSNHKDEFQEKHGVKLGFMSAFVKAATVALQEQPIVNAVIDDEAKELVYRDYVDISVAVATPTGLVVPVLRDCQSLSFGGIETTLVDLGTKAREGNLSLEEMAGGTFTISNGGVYGSLMGTPIINPPQSAILGMHGINKRPVVVDDQIVIRPMMYLALTYDHRLIDGRDAVIFLKRVKELVEDPTRFLLS